jgi:hypothetical protein
MTRLLQTAAVFAALCLVSAPAMAGGYNPFAFGSVWTPYQNQIQYPVGGWNGYNYGYITNYGYYPVPTVRRPSYGTFNSFNRSRGGSVPAGTTIHVPTPAGPMKVDHIGLPGLQNVITLPPGATVVGY